MQYTYRLGVKFTFGGDISYLYKTANPNVKDERIAILAGLANLGFYSLYDEEIQAEMVFFRDAVATFQLTQVES